SQKRSLVMVSSYAPGYFIPGVDVAAYAGALRFLAKHGYTEVYRPLAMQTFLTEFAIPPWLQQKRAELSSQGLEVKPFDPSMTVPLLEFTKHEFPGDWVRIVRETIAQIVAANAPPARLIVAIDNGNIVGFSHYEDERFGPIGVAVSQRGRGVGQLLMFAT